VQFKPHSEFFKVSILAGMWFKPDRENFDFIKISAQILNKISTVW
jgi:hypothetical protein